MRAIKFRGKRIDNGEWHYGNFIDGTDSRTYIMDFASVDTDAFSFHEVDPATVGQFTGLHDKKGKEIYEGDILRSAYTQRKYAVKWSNQDSMFVAGEDYHKCLNVANWGTSFVIGNIYENSELITP